MKKKVLSILGFSILAISIASCGSKKSKKVESGSQTTIVSTSSEALVSSGVTTTTSEASSTTTSKASSTTTSKASSTTTSTSTTTTVKEDLHGDVEYKSIIGGIEITSYIPNTPNLVIPETIDGKKVVALADDLFMNNTTLKSVTIPSGVKSISQKTFYGCSNLETVVLPEGLTATEFNSFAYCPKLKSINFPSTMKEIGYGAFYGCTSLESIVIPESVTSIGQESFYNCYKLREIINHSNLTFELGATSYGYIAKYALVINTTNDESKIFEEGDFKYIDVAGSYYMIDCINSKRFLELPEAVKDSTYTVAQTVLYNDSKAISVKIPSGITVERNAFRECRIVEIIDMSNNNEISLSASNAIYVNRTGSSIIEKKGDYYVLSNLGSNYVVDYDGINTTLMLCDTTVLGEGYKIGNRAFCNQNQYKLINILNVSEIPSYAFEKVTCDVMLSTDVAKIGISAFDGANIFYKGTKDEFALISTSGYYSLGKSKVYYYSEEKPTEEGNYWHYVAGKRTIWE